MMHILGSGTVLLHITGQRFLYNAGGDARFQPDITVQTRIDPSPGIVTAQPAVVVFQGCIRQVYTAFEIGVGRKIGKNARYSKGQLTIDKDGLADDFLRAKILFRHGLREDRRIGFVQNSMLIALREGKIKNVEEGRFGEGDTVGFLELLLSVTVVYRDKHTPEGSLAGHRFSIGIVLAKDLPQGRTHTRCIRDIVPVLFGDDTVDPVGSRMKIIETQMKRNEGEDEDTASHTEGQPHDIDKRIGLIAAQDAQRDPEVVF